MIVAAITRFDVPALSYAGLYRGCHSLTKNQTRHAKEAQRARHTKHPCTEVFHRRRIFSGSYSADGRNAILLDICEGKPKNIPGWCENGDVAMSVKDWVGIAVAVDSVPVDERDSEKVFPHNARLGLDSPNKEGHQECSVEKPPATVSECEHCVSTKSAYDMIAIRVRSRARTCRGRCSKAPHSPDQVPYTASIYIFS